MGEKNNKKKKKKKKKKRTSFISAINRILLDSILTHGRPVALKDRLVLSTLTTFIVRDDQKYHQDTKQKKLARLRAVE
jgi:hypothetical protein